MSIENLFNEGKAQGIFKPLDNHILASLTHKRDSAGATIRSHSITSKVYESMLINCLCFCNRFEKIDFLG